MRGSLGGAGNAGAVSIQAVTADIDGSTIRTQAANAIGGQLSIVLSDTLLLTDFTVITDGLSSDDGSSLTPLDGGHFLVINDSQIF